MRFSTSLLLALLSTLSSSLLHNKTLSVPLPSSSPSLANSKLTFPPVKFDTLPPALHFHLLPNPYAHLNFSPSFSVFAPRSPAFKDYITPEDLNCAASPPNALLGSRASEGGPGASFEIGNASEMIRSGLEPSFSLLGMTVKPLNAPEPGVRVWVKGYQRGKGEEGDLEWGVDFPSGFHEPFVVDLGRFSRREWDGLWRVEIGADFGEGRLDWEFCLDDLVVGFVEREGMEVRREQKFMRID